MLRLEAIGLEPRIQFKMLCTLKMGCREGTIKGIAKELDALLISGKAPLELFLPSPESASYSLSSVRNANPIQNALHFEDGLP